MGLKHRRGTAASATSANPVLEASEIGYETDTGKWKLGDGSTAWNSLAYQPTAGSGGDFSTSVGTSVANEIVLFDGTTGKLGKRASTTGILKGTSGVLSAATPGTDYYNPGGTDVAVADGGTGASTAGGARTALGLVIGTDVQAWDADLDTIAGLTATTNNFLVAVASAWASRTPAQVKTTLSLDNVDNTSDATKNSATATISNKRRTPRVFATASTATLTPEIDTYDAFKITAQAAALNIANHSTSTPADFEQMRIRIIDNGTARAITYGTNYVARGGVALPSTTVISKYLELGFEWFDTISKWVLLAVAQET